MRPLPASAEEFRKWQVENAEAQERKKWRHDGGAEVEPDINVTPLVDISLVLVIIFLVTSPFMTERDIKVVSNTKKEQATQIVKTEKLSLILTTDLKTHVPKATLRYETADPAAHKRNVENKDYPLDDTLGAAIAAKIQLFKPDDRILYLEPSDDSLHGDVVTALDQAKSNGVERLSFVTKEKSAEGQQ